MDPLSQRVAGLFRRGLPEGEQFELLLTWVAHQMVVAANYNQAKLFRALSAAIDRGNEYLSNEIEK